MSLTKICKKCGIEKDISEFNILRRKSRKTTSVQSWCKLCIKNYVSNRYKTNVTYRQSQDKRKKENIIETSKRYRLRHRDKVRESTRISDMLTKTGLRGVVLDRSRTHCEVCKNTVYEHRYAIHHIDGNRNNNVLENLMVVCTHCHLAVLHKSVIQKA